MPDAVTVGRADDSNPFQRPAIDVGDGIAIGRQDGVDPLAGRLGRVLGNSIDGQCGRAVEDRCVVGRVNTNRACRHWTVVRPIIGHERDDAGTRRRIGGAIGVGDSSQYLLEISHLIGTGEHQAAGGGVIGRGGYARARSDSSQGFSRAVRPVGQGDNQ